MMAKTASTILVIDDSQFWRCLAADGLRLKGHLVETAEDASTGLAIMQRGRVDLLILELQLASSSGLDLLDQVRRLPLFRQLPVILLTGEMQKDQVVRSRLLGATDILLKAKFSLMELIDRVERRLEQPAALGETRVAAAIASPPMTVKKGIQPRVLLTREQCLARASQVMGTRTLSGVVSKVIASASSPRTDMSDLAALVGRDPMLSARVVAAANRLENAADRRVISTLMDAVRVIGSAAVRDIASSLWVYDTMPTPEPDGYNPLRCWQHSIAVARLCDLLATEEYRAIAYLLGLCHDLGEVIFRSHFGGEYRKVLETVASSDVPRPVVEKQMLGLTHGELVQSILTQLGLPDAILQPIAAFHSANDHGTVANIPAARLLLIADAFSTGLMLNSSDQTGVRPLYRVECRAATGQDEPPPINCAMFRAEVSALTAECARLSLREQADLLPAMPVRTNKKVWLARDPSLSCFDPIATALEPMVELSVHTRLPTAVEIAGYKAVIVVARNTSTHGLTPHDTHCCIDLARSKPLVLYLCAKNAPTEDDPEIMFSNWPVSFGLLEGFIRRLGG